MTVSRVAPTARPRPLLAAALQSFDPSAPPPRSIEHDPSGRGPRRRRRPAGWVVVTVIAALAGAAAISAATAAADSGTDLLEQSRTVARAAAHLRGQFAAAVVALAVLHYLASAIAARAACGLPLHLRETFLVQLSAAAANRLTPAGLGGSAVNVRYFTRRGLGMPAALGAVAALGVFGALADLLVLIMVIAAGTWLHLGGGPHEITLLSGYVVHMLGPARSPWLWGVVFAVGAAVAVWVTRRNQRRPGQARRFWQPTMHLLRRPRTLATLLLSSGSTTLILGFAFIATIAMVPGPQPLAPAGALLVAFMIGAAAGSSVPIPAGLGSTEAALVAVLLSVHVPLAHALEVVLIFRLVTFWLPAVFGVLASRRLYRLHAL